MSVLAQFTAPDDTDLADYLCDTGEAWTVHSGGGSVQGDALQARSGILRATVDGDVRGTVSAAIAALGGVSPPNVGLIWRYADLSNHWYSGSTNPGGGSRYQVRKVVAGVDSQVSLFSSGPAPALNDELRVVLTPAGCSFMVNGVLLGSIADVALASASRVGVFMPSGIEGNGPKVDDFQAEFFEEWPISALTKASTAASQYSATPGLSRFSAVTTEG